MATIKLRAVVDLEHRGRPIAAGEVFEADQHETLQLAYDKKVEFAATAPIITRDMSPGAPSTVTSVPRQKRQYRRRDLVAES